MGGSQAIFSGAAVGTPPLSYRWLHNDFPIGAVSNVLTLANVRRSDSGSYRVVVTNEFGNATSTEGVLRVRVPQRIVLDGEALVFGDSDSGAMSTNELGLFEVQTSSNLVDWLELHAELIATNGTLQYRHMPQQSGPARFYRIFKH